MNWTLPSIGDVLRVMKDIVGYLFGQLEAVKWIIVKAAPLLAIPVFFLTSVGALLSNDTLWNKYEEVQGIINNSSGGAQSNAAVWFARMNYVFPIEELFYITSGLLQLLFICTSVRAVKAWIPTLT